MKLFTVATALLLGIGIGYFFNMISRRPKSESVAGFCAVDDRLSVTREIFVIDGHRYSIGDLPISLQIQLFQSQQEGFERSQDMIDKFALRLALSGKGDGIKKPSEVPELSELLKDKWVTDQEVREFYERNVKAFPAGVKFDALSASIRSHLEKGRVSQVMHDAFDAMNKENRYASMFASPCGPLVNLDVNKELTLQSKTQSKTTLTVLSDFSCIQCAAMFNTLAPWLERLTENSNVVHKSYALNESSVGFSLAKGYICAGKQGQEQAKSWLTAAYIHANGPKAEGDDSAKLIQKIAQEVRLQSQAFESCFADPEVASQVLENGNFARQLGRHDQLTIFINGHVVLANKMDQLINLVRPTPMTVASKL